MQRRKFIRAGAAGAVGMASSRLAASKVPTGPEPELIEWRRYDMAFRGDEGLLRRYFDDALAPALMRKGATRFMLFKEYGDPNPTRLHLAVTYPTATAYYAATDFSDDGEFQVAQEEYTNKGSEKPIFNRYSSWLLRSFDGMPVANEVKEGKELFELRIYESPNEDALRRKIKMFNEYELDIFDDTGLTPVFFGDMVAGPYRPALMYLLQFDDMDDREVSWGKFGANATWNEIKGMEEFADTLSNIRRTFLVPA